MRFKIMWGAVVLMSVEGLGSKQWYVLTLSD